MEVAVKVRGLSKPAYDHILLLHIANVVDERDLLRMAGAGLDRIACWLYGRMQA